MKHLICVATVLLMLVLANIGPLLAPAAQATAPVRSSATALHRTFLPLITLPGPPPTSEELIEAALKQAVIDAETALIHKVFATVGDARLPAQFQGDNSQVLDSAVMAEARRVFNTLSPGAQATLRPFMIPPAYRGSWWTNRTASTLGLGALADPPVCAALAAGWAAVDTLNGKARIWYQTKDRAQAELAAATMEEAWGKLTQLMGRAPLPDTDDKCSQGDGRLDVYLVDIGVDGLTDHHGAGYEYDSTFILLKRRLDPRTLRGAVIHELMHAIQWAYDVAAFSVTEYGWLMDATANWAIDFVDRTNNVEQDYAKYFMATPNYSLDDDVYLHEYGAYVFPLYLHYASGPDTIRKIWEATSMHTSSLAAVNAVIDGGLHTQWPLFIPHLWNDQPEPLDSFQRQDGLRSKVVPEIDVSVTLSGSLAQYSLPTSIPHLASKFYRFTFADSTARSVAVYHPFSGANYPNAKVQALAKIGGQWRAIEDWTDQPGHAFCRDMQAERLQELVVIVSNSTWEDTEYVLRAAEEPRLVATNIGCWRWRGTATVTARRQSAQANMNEITNVSNLIFQRATAPAAANAQALYQEYRILAGTAAWHHAGRYNKCAGSGSGSYSVTAGSAKMLIWSFSDPVGIPYQYWISGVAPNNGLPYTITYTCTNSSFEEAGLNVLWLDTQSQPLRVSADGFQLRSSASAQLNDTMFTWTWDLTAEAEP